MTKVAAIVLAAGKGTRMNSALPKVMHRIAGRSMIGHVLDSLEPLGLEKLVVVIGPDMPEVAAEARPHQTVVQQRQLGTGHAAGTARAAIGEVDDTVLVMFGDTPFVAAETFRRLLARRGQPDRPAIVVLGMRPRNPTGYGRLVTDAKGNLTAIVEERDADAVVRAIGLCNSGVMAVDGKLIWSLIEEIGTENTQSEYYLTDIVTIALDRGRLAAVIEAPADELIGVNSREELAAAEALCQERLRQRAFDGGVTMVDPGSVFLAADTRLGRDVVIGPNVVFGPGVTVGERVEIRAFSHIEGAAIDNGAIIGPFARLRPGSRIGAGAHIGNFVETKNAEIGAGAKANHLTYLGDTEVGARSNIGAGTITCNYDGFQKTRTTIGADVFIGSNTALVAPVTVGEGAFVAAGSVVTEDVAPHALALARGRQVEKPGWAARFRAASAALKDRSREARKGKKDA